MSSQSIDKNKQDLNAQDWVSKNKQIKGEIMKQFLLNWLDSFAQGELDDGSTIQQAITTLQQQVSEAGISPNTFDTDFFKVANNFVSLMANYISLAAPSEVDITTATLGADANQTAQLLSGEYVCGFQSDDNGLDLGCNFAKAAIIPAGSRVRVTFDAFVDGVESVPLKYFGIVLSGGANGYTKGDLDNLPIKGDWSTYTIEADFEGAGAELLDFDKLRLMLKRDDGSHVWLSASTVLKFKNINVQYWPIGQNAGGLQLPVANLMLKTAGLKPELPPEGLVPGDEGYNMALHIMPGQFAINSVDDKLFWNKGGVIFEFSGGGGIVDSELSETSENSVQNKLVTKEFSKRANISSTYDNNTSAGDPGAGFFRLNGVQNALYISYTQNSNIKHILEKLGDGSILKIQSLGNKYLSIDVTGVISDMSTWASIPINPDNIGDALVDGDLCGLLVIGGAGVSDVPTKKINFNSELLFDNDTIYNPYDVAESVPFTLASSANKAGKIIRAALGPKVLGITFSGINLNIDQSQDFILGSWNYLYFNFINQNQVDLTITQGNAPIFVDTDKPVFNSAIITDEQDTILKLLIDDSSGLDTGSVPDVSAFTIERNSVPEQPSVVGVGANFVNLTLGSAALAGEVFTVAYTKPGVNPIRDVSSNNNEMDSFTAQPVTNNVGSPAAPVVNSAQSQPNGLYVELTFNKVMADPTGKHAQFNFSGGKTAVSVELKSGDNSTFVFTMDSKYLAADSIFIGYTPGDVAAQDGSLLQSFSNHAVINNIVDGVNRLQDLLSTSIDLGNPAEVRGTDPYYLLSWQDDSGNLNNSVQATSQAREPEIDDADQNRIYLESVNDTHFRSGINANLYMNSNFSMGFKVNFPDGKASQSQYFGQVLNTIYRLLILNTGQIEFLFGNTTDGFVKAKTVQAVVPDGVTGDFNVFFVVDYDNNQMKIYYNGVLQSLDATDNGDISGLTPSNFNTAAAFECNGALGGVGSNHYMKRFTIWTEALTDADATDLNSTY
ncbi:SwmB domain-containing protein [Carboxylicivirga marina]|uniref:SwmB domain-containing protein n=1 Tax=Carboxylicivirga marina TaxID=2800988 RepID=UPI0025954EA0|nr:SwmB domain-containing protein [uncultured Carboxylicivirga sp.]